MVLERLGKGIRLLPLGWAWLLRPLTHNWAGAEQLYWGKELRPPPPTQSSVEKEAAPCGGGCAALQGASNLSLDGHLGVLSFDLPIVGSHLGARWGRWSHRKDPQPVHPKGGLS